MMGANPEKEHKNMFENGTFAVLGPDGKQVQCDVLFTYDCEDNGRSYVVFTTGEGFSNIVGTYIMHRLAICGFKAFNNVHFYDYMVFQEARHGTMRDEAAVMFAISQSGETEPVLNDVRHAKQHGHKIVTFTRRGDSTLAQLSDLVFVIDGAKQTLAGSLPNPFFGYVILTFENLMARYFDQNESV